MKKPGIIILLLVAAMSVMAVPATPDSVVRVLEDGTTCLVRIYGDEFYHYMTNLSGEELIGSRVQDDALLTAMRHVAPRRAPQATLLNSYVPSKGTVRIPVILVNFTDLKFTLPNPAQQFTDLFNGNGGSNPHATGSVHTYYAASSHNQLNLVYDVYGPYDLSNTMAYYGQNSGSSSAKNVSKLIVEAAKLARDEGKVNFAPYDNDGDGYIDNLSVVVAGYNEAEGGPEDAIWPHYSSVSSTERFSSKRLNTYLIISEFRGSGGSIQAGIGTYCHEFGHALGLADLYDTENSSRYTIGAWDLMCSGCYNNSGSTPPSLSAFERFMMGWLTPKQLSESNTYILPPLETSNQACLVAVGEHNLSALSPSPNEYFLLENRQAMGWDAGKDALVGTGLMVSHISFYKSRWDYNTFNNYTPLGYAIVSAGVQSPVTSTAHDLFPGLSKVTTWLPVLYDETQLKDQLVSGIHLLADSSMAFHYGSTGDRGFFFYPDEVPLLTTTYDRKPYHYDVADISVRIRHIDADTICLQSTTDLFDFSIDSGSTWITKAQPVSMRAYKDSDYIISVLVRHAPIRTSCSVRTGYLSCFTPDESFVNQLPLSGISPRPTYITKPTVLEPTELTSTSFSTHWEAQEDAQYYYMTLFSVADSASLKQKDFSSFTSIDRIAAQGWEANFARLLHSLSETGSAVYFTQSEQYLRTEQYFVPPTQLRFWLSNNYTDNEDLRIGGNLLLQAAAADTQWVDIETIKVQKTTKNVEKIYTLDSTKHYVFFRFVYTHSGGDGGTVLDGVCVSMPKTLRYVSCDVEVDATTTSGIFNHLQPATSYYFSVKAYENKGCTEHYSPASDRRCITTLEPVGKEPLIRISRTKDGIYTANLPETSNGSSSLYIYSLQGTLVQVIDVPYATLKVSLPTQNWEHGHYYIVKLLDRHRLSRNGARGKFYYE